MTPPASVTHWRHRDTTNRLLLLKPHHITLLRSLSTPPLVALACPGCEDAEATVEEPVYHFNFRGWAPICQASVKRVDTETASPGSLS